MTPTSTPTSTPTRTPTVTTPGIARRLLRGARAAAWLLASLLAVIPIALHLGVLGWSAVQGGQAVVITSDSMSPHLHARDVVLVREVPAEELTVGDVVTVRRPTGILVTHRIVALDHDQSGALQITTQGDANNVPDSDPAAAADVVGVAGPSLPAIGQALVLTQSAASKVATIAPLALLVIAGEVRRLWRSPDQAPVSVTTLLGGPTPPSTGRHRPVTSATEQD